MILSLFIFFFMLFPRLFYYVYIFVWGLFSITEGMDMFVWSLFVLQSLLLCQALVHVVRGAPLVIAFIATCLALMLYFNYYISTAMWYAFIGYVDANSDNYSPYCRAMWRFDFVDKQELIDYVSR